MSKRPIDRREFTAALWGTAAAGVLPGSATTSDILAEMAHEVERLERQLVAAIATTDLSTYDRIVADDYLVVQASGVELTKAAVMESYRDGTRGYRDLRLSDVKVHLYGDTAVVAARSTSWRRENGREVPNDVRYVRVYVRRRGKWQAVSQMATPIPPA